MTFFQVGCAGCILGCGAVAGEMFRADVIAPDWYTALFVSFIGMCYFGPQMKEWR